MLSRVFRRLKRRHPGKRNGQTPRALALDRAGHYEQCDSDCAHARYGGLLWSLIVDPSWIQRRTETVEFLDAQRYEQRVTLDVSVGDLRQRLEHWHLEEFDELSIPVAILSKNLLLDIDLKDDSGKSLSVATSFEDSFAAQLVCNYLYDNKSALDDWFFATALGEGGSNDGATPLSSFSVAQYFSGIFMMMTSIDVSKSGRQLLKFRLVETSAPLRNPWSLGVALGLQSRLVLIDAPSIGRAEQDHLRVIAPPGTFIESAYLTVDSDSGVSGIPYRYRLTPDRLSIYTRDAPFDQYLAVVALRARAAGPMLSTMLAALVMSLIAVALLVVEHHGRILSSSSPPAAPVALIIAVTSLAAGYVFRQDEHRVFSKHISGLRTLTAMSAVVLLAAGLAVALSQGRLVLLIIIGVAALVALITFLTSAAALLASSYFSRLTYRDAEMTHEDNVR